MTIKQQINLHEVQKIYLVGNGDKAREHVAIQQDCLIKGQTRANQATQEYLLQARRIKATNGGDRQC